MKTLVSITPEQMKASRQLLGWSQVHAALAADVSPKTIVNIELGRIVAPKTVAKIRAALEAAGVEFIANNGGGAGVRLKTSERMRKSAASGLR